jgi:DNA primase catalytic core
MARIPEDEIVRLKQEVSLVRLVEGRGIELKRHGADLVGLCPFHDDHEPSLVVSPGKNLWHCLGACQAGGSVIDWVMRSEGVSFRHAAELLREGHPLTGAGPASSSGSVPGRPVKQSTVRKLPVPFEREAEDAVLLGQVIDFYHEALKQSPKALSYLEQRGLVHPEMLGHFKLGYANRTLGYRLPATNRQAGAELRGRLQTLGIIRKSGHEHFNGSVVIPVIDEQGRVAEVYGRKITSGLRKGTPRHLYLPGPHRGVFNVAALTAGASEEMILCESLIDALTFWCAGFRNVTASYGIEGFTDEHLEAFGRYETRRVLIAYDRDDAGEKAAQALASRLGAAGMECFRVQFPRGMDANEYAQAVQPAAKSLELVIRKAEWMGKGPAPSRALAVMPEFDAEAEAEADEEEEAAKEEKGGDREAAAPVPSRSSISPLAAEEAAASTASPASVASPVPPAPSRPVRAEQRGEEVVLRLGDRRWRVRGLGKNLSFGQLKVNVLVSRQEGSSVATGAGPAAFHVDTFDLYNARQRQAFVKQAADELGCPEEVVKKDLGKVLLELEGLQERQIEQTLAPKEQAVTMSEGDKAAALELLCDPRLLDRILEDFDKCGVVGEQTNKLVGYLAAVSRKLEEPLAVIIQSSSAAGKTSLMDAVLAFVPAEQRVKYSAMTGQSLFYLGETDLKHKVLAIVEEEGAERASYALKLLQSEGELTIASTGKDPATGRLVTQEYRVEGPVMILLTTTAVEIDEELQNRALVLTVDEEREQTRAIHRLQRRSQTLEGLLERREQDAVLKVHQDAQRLLRSLLVANPYAERLTFLDDRTRARRDHVKYLTLIRTIALLHQYQRPTKNVVHRGRRVSYIEVTSADIAVANRLAHQVLGRSLDELAPQTRRLLMMIDELVSQQCARLAMDRQDYRFTRRDVRQHSGLGNTQLKLHLHRLEDLEYLLVHRGGRGQQFVYELLYDGQGRDGTPFLPRLLDIAELDKQPYDEKKSGAEAGLSGGGRPQVGAKSAPGRGGENGKNGRTGVEIDGKRSDLPKNAHLERPVKTYVLRGRSDVGADVVAAKVARAEERR